MRIFIETALKTAYAKHPNAKPGLQSWKKLVKQHKWNCFDDVKKTSLFAPDMVGNFVIFDIGGNKYRLITFIDYETKCIFIRNFLTHAEYDKGTWRNDEWYDA
jgi:mRNA interferase HigB